MSVFVSDTAIIIYEAFAAAGLVVNSIRLGKKNKKLTEMVSLQKDRIREEELDAKLQNQMHQSRSEETAIKNNPYEVNYHEEADASYENEKEHISIQVEESGTLSNKKYVVHVFDQIKIGRADSNKIILNDTKIAAHQLELLRVEKDLFVKSLDTEVKVTLRRKKKRFTLDQTPVCLVSGDILNLGNTTLKISVI